MSESPISRLVLGRNSPTITPRTVVKEPKELPLRQFAHKPQFVDEAAEDCDGRTTRSSTPALTWGSGPSSLSGRPIDEPAHGAESEFFDAKTHLAAPWSPGTQELRVPSVDCVPDHRHYPDPDPESDSDGDSDESGFSDDEWSGQEDNIGPVVHAAVGTDLKLAAYLIPILHQQLSRSVNHKVDIWQSTMTVYGGQHMPPVQMLNDEPSEQTTSGSYSQQSGSHKSKKRKHSGSSNGGREVDDIGGDGGGGDDEDDGDGEGHGDEQPNQALKNPTEIPQLACPFNKFDPEKYCQHGSQNSQKKGYYRTCMGPGFRGIPRLKEHLRRKHFPVQCDRCYKIFSNPDRAVCMSELAEHRKSRIPCEIGDEALQEGISPAQWEKLDGKRGRKGSPEKDDVTRWFEIYRVLFPGRNEPQTPWYEPTMANASMPGGSPQTIQFLQLFNIILDQRVRDAGFPPHWRGSMEAAADAAFRLWLAQSSLRGSTESTSSRTRSLMRRSLVGGSSTHPSSIPYNDRYGRRSSLATTRKSQASSGSYNFHTPPPLVPSQARTQAVSTPRQPPQFNTPWAPLTPSSPHFGQNGLNAMPEGALPFPTYPMDSPSPAMHSAVFSPAFHTWRQPQGVFPTQGNSFGLQPSDFLIPSSGPGDALSSPLMTESMDSMNDLNEHSPFD